MRNRKAPDDPQVSRLSHLRYYSSPEKKAVSRKDMTELLAGEIEGKGSKNNDFDLFFVILIIANVN